MSQNLAEKAMRQGGKDDLGSALDKIINLFVASILTHQVCAGVTIGPMLWGGN